MSDFREAYEQGLAAWRDAERARREISEVFDRFAAEVQASSGGQLLVQRDLRPGPGARAAVHSAPGGFRPIIIGPTYEALVARLAEQAPGQGEEICRYEFAETGYPVTLRYSRAEERCHDLAALEEGLKRMLASPAIGGVFARLIDGSKAA